MSSCNGCSNRGDETFDPEFEGPSDEDIARFGDCADDDYDSDCGSSSVEGSGNISSPVRACYECGKEIYEDAAVCNVCGSFQLKGTVVHSSGRRSIFRKFRLGGVGLTVFLIYLVLKGLGIF